MTNRLIVPATCFALAVVALWLSPAPAQQPAPAPDYTITLNGQEWFQVGEALADRPFKIANPILVKINQQITEIAMKRQKDEADARAKAAEPKSEEKAPTDSK